MSTGSVLDKKSVKCCILPEACVFYLWDSSKNRIYRMSPTWKELKQNWRNIFGTIHEELLPVNFNLFK
jgi:hypothetical protein